MRRLQPPPLAQGGFPHQETTGSNYRGLRRRHVFPAIGHKSLDGVTREDIKDIIAAMVKRGLSKSVVTNAIASV
ncbi:MAG TPA: hypothetical protein VNP04_08735 [Alphaproteobacteria bacterium]|nr:hypothetical protein [Alphaproteobacteria bacterium]